MCWLKFVSAGTLIVLQSGTNLHHLSKPHTAQGEKFILLSVFTRSMLGSL
jgi:hypothetical protein